MENGSLKAMVNHTEMLKLRDDRGLILAQLDVSYLQVLQFERHLCSNQVKSRKRPKSGLPAAKKIMTIWLHQPSGERVELQGQVAMSSPLDAPATLSLELPYVDLLPVGSVVEFEICNGGTLDEEP